MGDKVPGNKMAKLGAASLALVVAVTTGSVLFEGRADAATDAPAGRQTFVDLSCGACHVLQDAGGTGHVGPQLDGAKLSKAFVLGRISNGQGAMPSFAGMVSNQELDDLAAYIADQSNK